MPTEDPPLHGIADACDTHVHVFDPARFPYASCRRYTPPPATAATLQTFMRAMGVRRTVLVQASVSGTDNAGLVDALGQLGSDVARGIAVVDPDIVTDTELQWLDAAGVRGIRINLVPAGVVDAGEAARLIEVAARRIAPLGWMLQLYADMSFLGSQRARLAQLPIPLVFDHFAGAKGELGIDQPGMRDVLALVESGQAYVKLSATYRASSSAPRREDLEPIARAFLQANAERVIWGTDWPHTQRVAHRDPNDTGSIDPFLHVEDARECRIVTQWMTEKTMRTAVFAENASRLFGFGHQP